MIREAIQKIEEMASPSILKFDEKEYTSKPIHPVRKPHTELKGMTLTLIVESAVGCRQPGYFIQVPSPDEVVLFGYDEIWGDCKRYTTSKLPDSFQKFKFGIFQEVEEFIIGCKTCFQETPDLHHVLQVVGNLTAGTLRTVEDDGVSQMATVKAGVHLKGSVVINPIVELAPFRSFLEIDQVPGKFLLRLKSREDALPQVALFEAEGSIWKIEAIRRIKEYLRARVENLSVLG